MLITLKELGKRLGCSDSNASHHLRCGNIKGKKLGKFWDVEEKDIQYYLDHKHDPKPIRPRIRIVHNGDKFGYWTIIDANIPVKRGQQRRVRARCICGKEKLICLESLTLGKSKSCGCKRSLHQTQRQKYGQEKGRALMEELHKKKLGGRYIGSRLNKNSTTGHTGVSKLSNGKYRAYISPDRKQINLGCFEKIEDAIKARKAAEEKYFRPKQDQVNAIKKKYMEESPGGKK